MAIDQPAVSSVAGDMPAAEGILTPGVDEMTVQAAMRFVIGSDGRVGPPPPSMESLQEMLVRFQAEPNGERDL